MKKHFLFLLIISACCYTPSGAYTVTGLTALYQNGQTFLTWKNPDATNLKYKVYRSSVKINSASQLTDANYLGYVRDNSAKNIRKSKLEDGNFFFTINPNDGPLASDDGLYVATCTDNKKHFYAVTVVDLSTGVEDKTITLDENSMSKGVKEHKPPIQPILQATTVQANGDVNYEYAIFGNNQDAPNEAAFNNCGSYGYNYTFVDRSNSSLAPLYVKFQDDNPFEQVGSDECSDCNILVLDDWIPNGNNTYWVGFNTHYNMYDDTSKAQTSGTVRTYTQNRLREIFDWAALQPGVDNTRVYSSGFSHNGFGAMLTSVMMPAKIAATQENSSPILIKAVAGTFREGQWCRHDFNLNSDVIDPNTGDSIPIWDLLDMRSAFRVQENNSLPFMSGSNGKQDVTVGWIGKFFWYDSVNVDHHGGTWFWDQRNHTGDGKNFTVDETNLDFSRFATNKSYPAFAYCSINQNPGNGKVNNGDAYGAINGYLDWNDASINDEKCGYSINCFVKDMTVGGVLQTQYDSCTADITLRRLQNFKPKNGQIINWSVTKSNNMIAQQGSFTYSSSSPITLHAVKIYKNGSTLSFNILNCQKEIDASTSNPVDLLLERTATGYTATLNLPASADVKVSVSDELGRSVMNKKISMNAGENSFSIPLTRGVYVLELHGSGVNDTRKIFF